MLVARLRHVSTSLASKVHSKKMINLIMKIEKLRSYETKKYHLINGISDGILRLRRLVRAGGGKLQATV